MRYCLSAGGAGSQAALVHEAADVIHLVVFMRGDPRTGFRGVHTISEVLGTSGDSFEIHDLYARPCRGGGLLPLDRPRNPDMAERVRDGGFDISGWPQGM